MEKKKILMNALVKIIAAIIAAVIGAVITHQLTMQSAHRDTVEFLSLHFDTVSASMQYEQALSTIFEENVSLHARIAALEGELEQIKSVPTPENNGHISGEPPAPTSPSGEQNVSLFDYSPVNSARWRPNQNVIHSTAVVDSLGNEYTAMTQFIVLSAGTGGSAYGEFFVDGKYSFLRGRLAAHELHHNRSMYVRVYADDRLVFVSDGIIRTTIPFDFEVDINDATFILIELYGRVPPASPSSHILAMDLVLVT